MRNLTKLTLVIAFFTLCSSAAFGQKFGYINSSELITSMPERDSVEVKLEKLQEELSSQLEAIKVEYNTKFLDYQKNIASYSASISKMKEAELSALETRYQEFSQIAQEDFQETQTQLMTPVVTRAQEAIKKVGKEQALVFVYDLAAGGLIFYDEATMVNVLPFVQKELGITPKPAAAPAK